MAFNVGSISVFTDQIKSELITKAIATGPTMDFVTVIPGIKYSQALNILDNTVSIQPASCGFTSNGSVAFSQRNIQVTALEVKESLCEKTLESYWLGMKMKSGSTKEDSLGQILADSYVNNIKNKNEYTIWQGNYLGSTASYSNFDGFCEIIRPEATRVQVTSLTQSATAATIIADVDAMWASVPVAIRDRSDLSLYLPLGDFDLYAKALRTANLYHFDGTQASIQGNVINYIPGLKVRGIFGLNGAKTAANINPWILTYDANLVIGTDLLNEEEKFDIWYSRDFDEVRVNIQYKLGTQVQFPEFIVTNF